MSTWRTLVVALAVCTGLWLIGCHEEPKQERNTAVDDANVTLAQMHAEQAAAAARDAARLANPAAPTTPATPSVPTTSPATPTVAPVTPAAPPASAPG